MAGRVAGECPNQGQIVDDAAEDDVGVEAADVSPPDGHGSEAILLGADRLEDRDRHVRRRRQEPGVRQLSLAARVEDRDLDRSDRAEAGGWPSIPSGRSPRAAARARTTAGS